MRQLNCSTVSKPSSRGFAGRSGDVRMSVSFVDQDPGKEVAVTQETAGVAAIDELPPATGEPGNKDYPTSAAAATTCN